MATFSIFEYFVNIIIFSKSDDLTLATFAQHQRYLKRKRKLKLNWHTIWRNIYFLWFVGKM